MPVPACFLPLAAVCEPARRPVAHARPWSAFLFVACALVLFAPTAQGQTLVSDLPDYPPGTIATLTGAGFQPGEVVRMEVQRLDQAGDWSWLVNADEMGEFVTSWDVCEFCAGASLRASAQGLSSGAFAECFFTDATVWTMTIAPATSNTSQTQLYTLTAANTSTGGGNQMGCITITIPSQFTPVGSPTIVPGSTTHAWSVSRVGQTITATANSNADRIEQGEGIQIRQSATAPASPAGSPFAWVSTARSNTNCTGSSFGIPENGSPTVSISCTAPAILCPANLTVNNDPGQCAAVVNFAAMATGTPAPAITYSQDPGTSFPVGTTTVHVTATNACGSTSCSFTVTVVDNTAPTLALVGANPVTLECHGAAFVDAGATASDNCPGVGAVVASGSVDVNTPGTYAVDYVVTDAHGNSATATRTVHVVDTTNPVVTLNGASEVTVECHAEYVESGASAVDACAGNLAVNVASGVDASTVGDYVVTYTATDPSGNSHAQSRTVHVVDTTNPLVTLNGPADITLECHGPAFVDPGANAVDACAGALPVSPSGSVDVNVVGDYVLTYSATDPSGNTHSQSRTVHVVDTTNPVVSLDGPADITLECHGPAFSDPGASAADACAGVLAVSVVGSVDVNTVGDYLLTYSATDPSGNSHSQSRTVHVVDTTNPVVTLNGPNDVTLECHGPAFVDPGATASDACAGTLPVSPSGSVDVNTVGDYLLTYTATDPSGNTHSQSRTVHVVDTTPPSISAAGAHQTIECPNVPVFTAPTASDACDGAPAIVDVSDVTTPGACAGLYSRTRTWRAVDASGNSSAPVSQTITVADVTPPVIGAAGANQSLVCPAVPVFTAPTANDGCDDSPVVFEVSDVTTPGACAGAYSRTKTWQARDCAGNLSATVSQTIDVSDPVAPTAAISGPPSGTIVGVGATVVLTGTVADNCDLQGAKWLLDSVELPAGAIGAGGAVSTSYAFTQPGVYQVRLVATDACGNQTTAALTPEGFEWTIIVYDPNGGFVTGGGWIPSPAGAYRSDPALTGKANFGFVSRYQRGARVPTGETEFQFKAGNLNFHSASYEWLVVSGAKAQYKGVGSINGAGSFGFMLTAIDGAQQGSGGGADRFRVKIWDRATSAVVYDNQYGQAEDSDASTALGGGSIVVHSAKGNSIPLALGNQAPILGASAPSEFALRPARPNPFAGATEIAFELPEPSQVTIDVYDVRGRKVATVADGTWDPGRHAASWDGRSTGGERLQSGVYFARFAARSLTSERRLQSVSKLHLSR